MPRWLPGGTAKNLDFGSSSTNMAGCRAFPPPPDPATSDELPRLLPFAQRQCYGSRSPGASGASDGSNDGAAVVGEPRRAQDDDGRGGQGGRRGGGAGHEIAQRGPAAGRCAQPASLRAGAHKMMMA
eukprot:1191255-Prorocentrum_minimum.AAC.2